MIILRPGCIGALALAACGRLGFDPLASDATSDGAPGIDAASTCFAAWVDGAVLPPPVQIAALATAGDERDPFLADDRTLYFSNGNDVLVATRTDRGSPFGPATVATDLSSPSTDLRVSMTADQLIVFVARDQAANIDIWSATRTTTAELFGGGGFVPVVSTNSADNDPEISDDGLRLYLAPSPGGNVQDLVVASRPTRADTFSPPQPIAELNTGAADGDPTLAVDGRVIVFARGPGGGEFDLLYSTRADRGLPFAPPAVIPNISQPGYDADGTLSDDACELIFASNRAGGAGGFDLYRSTIP